MPPATEWGYGGGSVPAAADRDDLNEAYQRQNSASWSARALPCS
jgi:hypothetical protein